MRKIGRQDEMERCVVGCSGGVFRNGEAASGNVIVERREGKEGKGVGGGEEKEVTT